MLLIPNANRIDRKQLNIIKVPARPETKHWEGIQHGQLATAIVNESKSRSLELLQEDWCVSKDKNRMMGVLTFEQNAALLPSLPEEASDMKFSLGVIHSNMGHYAVSFCVGAKVMVCTNGCFSGQFVLKHKHTKGLDLSKLISKGFDNYLKEAAGMVDMVKSYLSVPLGDKDAAYGIMKLVEDTGLKNRYADDVWREWLKPAHEEFADRNLWTFYNAVTEVAKGMTPDIQYRLLTRARPVLEETFLN